MIVNRAAITGIFTTLLAVFNKAFESAPSAWQSIAMLVPSTSGQNDYAWLSKFPKMQRWVGDKNIKALAAYKYVIVNEDFETTIEVDRNDIKDENLGIYTNMSQGAGASAKEWPDELVAEAVNGVFTLKCFDGQYMCDTDHPVGDGVVSNKITAVLSHATLALAQASFGAAKTAMRKFKDDEGRPLNCKPNILRVPPDLEDTANALMTVDKLEDGKPNPYKGAAKVEVDGRMTSATAWLLLDTIKPVKPFVFQEREKPVFVSQTDMSSDAVFMRKKFRFGAEARGASGYGFWQLCVGSTGTG